METLKQEFDKIYKTLEIRKQEHETVFYCMDKETMDKIKLSGPGRGKLDERFTSTSYVMFSLHFNTDVLESMSVADYNRYIDSNRGHIQVSTIRYDNYYDSSEYITSNIKQRQSFQQEGYALLQKLDPNSDLKQDIAASVRGQKNYFEITYESVSSFQRFLNPQVSINTELYAPH